MRRPPLSQRRHRLDAKNASVKGERRLGCRCDSRQHSRMNPLETDPIAALAAGDASTRLKAVLAIAAPDIGAYEQGTELPHYGPRT